MAGEPGLNRRSGSRQLLVSWLGGRANGLGAWLEGAGNRRRSAGPGWVRRGVPILMPVSRFPRRLDELRARRPEVTRLLVPMAESQIGDASMRDAVSAILRGGPAPGAGAFRSYWPR